MTDIKYDHGSFIKHLNPHHLHLWLEVHLYQICEWETCLHSQ